MTARAAVIALALGGCIFTGPRKVHVPAGATASSAAAVAVTAGDAVLRYVPAGADLVVELDLARLYGNPTIGAIARRALAQPAAELHLPGLVLPHGDAPLARATALVLVAYQVGTADAVAATFVVTRGEVAGAQPVADGVVVLAPPALVARIGEVVHGGAAALGGDAALMAVRARAMPAGAPGATLRVTARLGRDARIALAPVLGPDLAPAALSVWGDVVDDAALIAVADGHDNVAGGGERLQIALEKVRIGLAGSTALLALGVAPVVRGARIARHGDVVELIATIGPHRLAELASRLTARDAGSPAPAVAPGAPESYPRGP